MPDVPTKYSNKILKVKKRGAARIAKNLSKQIRPALDSGKFVDKKVRQFKKQGLSEKESLRKAFKVAKDLGFNVPDK